MSKELEEIIQNISITYGKNNSLFIGNSGFYLFELLSNRLNDKSELIAENILNSKYTDPSLCSGKAGVNWLFTFLHKEYEYIDLKTLNKIRSDDNLLKNISIDYLTKGNYDYLYGALGISYYLLYDIYALDIEYHTNILKILNDQLIRDKHFYYNDYLDSKSLNRKVSLGLSHGIPSILRYAIECFKKSVNSDLSLDLAKKLIESIMSYQNGDTKSCYFPAIVTIGENKDIDEITRLAWCYGDPGVAITLYHSGKIIQDKKLEEFGKQILLDTTSRLNLRDAMIFDGGLCHGSSGLLHIYNRMWLETKDVRFRLALETCLKSTLKMYTLENSNIEFPIFLHEENKRLKSHGLLEGNAGVGLAINSFLSSDLLWDYCLMLND